MLGQIDRYIKQAIVDNNETVASAALLCGLQLFSVRACVFLCCMCLCVCMCLLVCVFACMYACVCLLVCVCVCLHECVRVYVCLCACVHVGCAGCDQALGQ